MDFIGNSIVNLLEEISDAIRVGKAGDGGNFTVADAEIMQPILKSLLGLFPAEFGLEDGLIVDAFTIRISKESVD